MKLSQIATRADNYAKLTRKNKTYSAFFRDLAELIRTYAKQYVTQDTKRGDLAEMKSLMKELDAATTLARIHDIF